MTFKDFAVRYDPAKDTQDDITKRIFYSLILQQLKHRKPRIMFIGADSGEGKSWTALRIQEIILGLLDLKLEDYLDDINVFTPIQYPQKIERLLFDKRLKRIPLITIHEAREVVKAKLWHNFLPQAISDINAMSRTIKRMCIIIISQFIRDITVDVRYTLNYYCKVSRPIGEGCKLTINVLWKDDRDIHDPKIRKRRLMGYLIMPDGRYKRFFPSHFLIKRPSKEVIQRFEVLDHQAKSSIIKRKVADLVKQIKEDIGQESEKVDKMVDFYIQNPQNITLVGHHTKGGKFKLRKEFLTMHDLSDNETLEFSGKLTKAMKDRGLL